MQCGDLAEGEDLRAFVLKLNGTAFETVIGHGLGAERGMGYAATLGDTHWRHWLPTWDPYAWFKRWAPTTCGRRRCPRGTGCPPVRSADRTP